MPRWLLILLALVLLLLGAASMYVIESGSNLRLLPSDNVGPAEFISIILTALSVILGALTLMIGVLAIMGWSSFQSIVERKAADASKEYLKDRFGDGDPDYLQIVEDIKEDVRLRLLAWTRENQNNFGNLNDQDVPAEDDPDA